MSLLSVLVTFHAYNMPIYLIARVGAVFDALAQHGSGEAGAVELTEEGIYHAAGETVLPVFAVDAISDNDDSTIGPLSIAAKVLDI